MCVCVFRLGVVWGALSSLVPPCGVKRPKSKAKKKARVVMARVLGGGKQREIATFRFVFRRMKKKSISTTHRARGAKT